MTGEIRTAAAKAMGEAEPRAKMAACAEVARAWRAGRIQMISTSTDPIAPDRPARPALPELVAPKSVPRRRLTSVAGRIALLHAVAHIEFNAIDLALDMVARFAGSSDLDGAARRAFVGDWLGVADDEARHFGLICDRLEALGAAYGDLPAHDGLWRAAQSTADDLVARLAIAPLVLEARGLDVTPGMIERLRAAGDEDSAERLETIFIEEHGHVAAGVRWFERLCAVRGLDPASTFQRLVGERFVGGVKAPINRSARRKAGMPDGYYDLLVRSGGAPSTNDQRCDSLSNEC